MQQLCRTPRGVERSPWGCAGVLVLADEVEALGRELLSFRMANGVPCHAQLSSSKPGSQKASALDHWSQLVRMGVPKGPGAGGDDLTPREILGRKQSDVGEELPPTRLLLGRNRLENLMEQHRPLEVPEPVARDTGYHHFTIPHTGDTQAEATVNDDLRILRQELLDGRLEVARSKRERPRLLHVIPDLADEELGDPRQELAVTAVTDEEPVKAFDSSAVVLDGLAEEPHEPGRLLNFGNVTL